MQRRRVLSTPLRAALATPFVTACTLGCPAASGRSTPSAATGTARPGQSVRGGTLVALLPRDAGNFDPVRQSDAYSSVVMANVVDSLYEIDKDGNVAGRLVEQTEQPQPNIYLMTLRKGLKFHDGTDLNAEAVKFNLERHINDPRSARIQDVQGIRSIQIPDAYTVKITLKAPYAPFVANLVGGAGYILSPRAVEGLGEALQRDLTGAGSGPFKFVEWKKDTQVVVERNPTYWKKDAGGEALPYLDRIVFKPFPDENVRLTSLHTGDSDILIGNPPFRATADLKRDPAIVVKKLIGLGFSVLLLNTQKEPFPHPAARRAFSRAIDRGQIGKTVFYDSGQVLDSPFLETTPWAYDKDDHPYLKRDPTRARHELTDAGKSNGFTFTLQIANNQLEVQQAAELIKDQIKGVKLDLKILPLDFGTVVANGSNGDFQAIALGFGGSVDPDGNLYTVLHSQSSQNFPRYNNPQVDQLLDEARATVDQSRRGSIYKQVQKIVLEDQPLIVYYNPPQICALRKTVQNYPLTYNGYWGARDYDKIWKAS